MKKIKENIGVFFSGSKKLKIKEFDIPELCGDEVLIRVKVGALCGSDLPAYRSPEAQEVVPGHEITGEIIKIGDNIDTDRLNKGSRVLVYPIVGCGDCFYCQQGKPTFCLSEEGGATGFSTNGGFAKYVVVKQEQCLLLPENMTFEDGVLLGDAVGTPYHAIKKTKIESGQKVAVVGTGPVGLGASLILKNKYNVDLIALEVKSYRKELAKKIGADIVLDPSQEDVVEKIHDITEGRGVNTAFDFAGNNESINLAINITAREGETMLVGECAELSVNPSQQIIHCERKISGSFYFLPYEWPEIVELGNHLHLENLITHQFSLKEAEEAFGLFDRRETGKVLLKP